MDDEDFRVEKIMDMKIDNGILKYLVKWEDYSEEDNTWDEASELRFLLSHELIVAFQLHRSRELVAAVQMSLQAAANFQATVAVDRAKDVKTDDDDGRT